MFKNLKDLVATREKLEDARFQLAFTNNALAKVRKAFDTEATELDIKIASKKAYLKTLDAKIKAIRAKVKNETPIKKTNKKQKP